MLEPLAALTSCQSSSVGPAAECQSCVKSAVAFVCLIIGFVLIALL